MPVDGVYSFSANLYVTSTERPDNMIEGALRANSEVPRIKDEAATMSVYGKDLQYSKPEGKTGNPTSFNAIAAFTILASSFQTG